MEPEDSLALAFSGGSSVFVVKLTSLSFAADRFLFLKDVWILILRRFASDAHDVVRNGCRSGGSMVTLAPLSSLLASDWPCFGRDFFAEDLLGFMAPKASHFFSGGSSKGMDIHGTICVRLENLGLALQPRLEHIISPSDEHAL